MRTIVDGIITSLGRAQSLSVAGNGGTVAWSQLHGRARRMAASLHALGVRRGDRVGLLGETSTELVAAMQAIWLVGGAITVLPPGNARTCGGIVADAGIKLVLTEKTPIELAAKVVPFSDLDAAPDVLLLPEPADLAILQYTSGSTRTPRGVPVTHANLAANVDAIKTAIGLEPGSRWLSWLPLYHDMGLIGFLFVPMSDGLPLVLQSPLDFARRPATWFEGLDREKATHTGAPNFAYRMLTQLLQNGLSADLSSVRFMLSGGEPIDAEGMAHFISAAAGSGLDPAAVVGAYGLAEATLAVAISPLRTDAIDRESLERHGVAVAGEKQLVRMKLVPGVTARVAGPRQVGQIELCGPSVIGNYWGCPPSEQDGWLRTGDLGYLTEAGDLVVCGREKDVLFAAGRNIYPQDIEAAAAQVPGVRPGGVAAFGVPGAYGDRLILAVEARSAELISAIAQCVTQESGMSPADIVILPFGRLPKTSSGKLRRAETRGRYLSGALTPERTVR